MILTETAKFNFIFLIDVCILNSNNYKGCQAWKQPITPSLFFIPCFPSPTVSIFGPNFNYSIIDEYTIECTI